MYRVTTEWFQQRTVNGKTTQTKLSTETEEFEWPDQVAEFTASFLREHPRVHFSGMEEFGSGSCLMEPRSLRCRAFGDCRAHHIESARDWVEKRVDELKPEESTDLCGGSLKWFGITITQVPEPEEDEPEDDEPEPEDEPDEPQPAEPEETPAEPAPAGLELTPTEPSGKPLDDRGPYTWHQVWEALDKAVELLGADVIGSGERDGDLMGLVKATALGVLNNPAITLDQVLNEEYADDGGAEGVREWWGNWA